MQTNVPGRGGDALMQPGRSTNNKHGPTSSHPPAPPNSDRSRPGLVITSRAGWPPPAASGPHQSPAGLKQRTQLQKPVEGFFSALGRTPVVVSCLSPPPTCSGLAAPLKPELKVFPDCKFYEVFTRFSVFYSFFPLYGAF